MKNKKLPSGKAVRDRIPKIIKNSGKECRIETLSEPLFYEAMKEKLTEEVGEYLSEPCPEELADIISASFEKETAALSSGDYSPGILEIIAEYLRNALGLK